MVRLYIADVRALEAEERFAAALALCSARRREKVSALRTAEDRRRSLGAAMALDYALQAFGLRERDTVIAVTDSGKPYLTQHPEICFSLSHAGDFALCAVSEYEIGADLEAPREISSALQRRCFRSGELAAAEARRLWVLKESYGKMTGRGVAAMQTSELIFGDTVRVWEDGKFVDAVFWEGTLPGGYRIAVCRKGSDALSAEQIWIPAQP